MADCFPCHAKAHRACTCSVQLSDPDRYSVRRQARRASRLRHRHGGRLPATLHHHRIVERHRDFTATPCRHPGTDAWHGVSGHGARRPGCHRPARSVGAAGFRWAQPLHLHSQRQGLRRRTGAKPSRIQARLPGATPQGELGRGVHRTRGHRKQLQRQALSSELRWHRTAVGGLAHAGAAPVARRGALGLDEEQSNVTQLSLR